MPVLLNAQIITTVAGGATGHGGYWGEGGLATLAQLGTASSVAVDTMGNIYIGDKSRILKVDASTGIIHTIAGTGVLGYNGDSIPAATAQINWAAYPSFDQAGNIYMSDGNNNRVRKIDAITGIITTFIGNGVLGSDGDGGPATSAKITVGKTAWDTFGNVYMSDSRKIRKISPTGVITTIAGTGQGGFTGEGVPAITTDMSYAQGIATDINGNVYCTDTAGAIRKITISTGLINRVAGTADNIRMPYSGDGIDAKTCHISPLDVYVDSSGNVYIADGNNNRIEKVDINGIIHTVAGNGTAGYSGDNGLALNAKLNLPQSLTFDRCGNLYFADYLNHRIRKVTFNPNCSLVDTTTAVHHLARLCKVTIYPNPTQNELTITNSNNVKTLNIINTMGQTVITQNCNRTTTTINVSGLSAGLYFIVLRNEGNGVVFRGRFVKE